MLAADWMQEGHALNHDFDNMIGQNGTVQPRYSHDICSWLETKLLLLVYSMEYHDGSWPLK